jgi:hypothetical protein
MLHVDRMEGLELIDATRHLQPLAPCHEAFRVGVGVETESYMLSRVKPPDYFTWPLSSRSYE